MASLEKHSWLHFSAQFFAAIRIPNQFLDDFRNGVQIYYALLFPRVWRRCKFVTFVISWKFVFSVSLRMMTIFSIDNINNQINKLLPEICRMLISMVYTEQLVCEKRRIEEFMPRRVKVAITRFIWQRVSTGVTCEKMKLIELSRAVSGERLISLFIFLSSFFFTNQQRIFSLHWAFR